MKKEEGTQGEKMLLINKTVKFDATEKERLKILKNVVLFVSPLAESSSASA